MKMYTEYNDLYEKAQKEKSGYLLCLIDVKNSKTDKNYIKYREQYIDYFKEISRKHGRKIPNCSMSFIDYYLFILGDAVAFVSKCRNKKLIDKKMFNIIKNIKLPLKFHYSSVYFETFDWICGAEKYYIGYAFQQAENNSKKK